MTERKEQFTPGPWERAIATAGHAWIFGDNRNRIIGEVQGLADGEGRANAALISAAPEMYYLLKELSMFFQYGPESNSERGQFYLSRISELMKKARGEA